MHLAIGMWALLAGGLVLPAGNDETNSSLPPVVAPYIPPTNVDAPQPGKRRDSAVVHRPPGRYEEARCADAFGRIAIRDTGRAMRTPLVRPRFMPSAPTDPSAMSNPMMPMAPTAGSGLTYGGGMNSRSGRFGSPGTGFGTGSGRTPSAFSAGSPRFRLWFVAVFVPESHEVVRRGRRESAQTFLRLDCKFRAASSPATTMPGPAISPYMNVFATNTRGVDPYNLFVRPAIQQQQQNMQVNTDISGLQTQTDQILAPSRPQDAGIRPTAGT